VGALYVAFKVARVVRRKGLKKAVIGAAFGLINSTGKGRAVVKAETEKTIKKLQEIVRRQETRCTIAHQRPAASQQSGAVGTELCISSLRSDPPRGSVLSLTRSLCSLLR